MGKLFSCLADATGGGSPWPTIIMIVVVVAVIGGMYFLSSRSQKKNQEKKDAVLNAVKPGNKVKTIGGVCGIVVELCPEDDTFILETGTEASGKSFIKFDKRAIFETDAVVETPVAETTKEEVPAQDVPAETPVEQPAQEENEKESE